MSRRRTRYDTNFGASVSVLLAERQTTAVAVARSIGKSHTYMNSLMVGRRQPSPEWVDLVADALDLKDEKRVELHKAAAMDHGFKLDLIKPK